MRDRELEQRSYAEFYSLYAGDFRQDIPVYLELAGKSGGPVLEVGCGVGRVTSYLAKAGCEIVAIDTSRPFLEIAARRLRSFPDYVRVHDHDLRARPLPQRFSSIFVSLYSFNQLIDIEEQRLFLRHLSASLASPGIVAIDFFCPLSMVRPEQAREWREISRVCDGRAVTVKDRREMLTPLLERRTQIYRVEGGPQGEAVTHRRYVTPPQAAVLMAEAGLERIRYVRDYDLSTAVPVEEAELPDGPFLIIGQAQS